MNSTSRNEQGPELAAYQISVCCSANSVCAIHRNPQNTTQLQRRVLVTKRLHQAINTMTERQDDCPIRFIAGAHEYTILAEMEQNSQQTSRWPHDETLDMNAEWTDAPWNSTQIWFTHDKTHFLYCKREKSFMFKTKLWLLIRPTIICACTAMWTHLSVKTKLTIFQSL